MFVRPRVTLAAMSFGAACAVLPLSGCTIDIGNGSSSGRTPSGGPGGRTGDSESTSPERSEGRQLRVGALTMKIPAAWTVTAGGAGGRWHITTGGACAESGYPEADRCRGWWVLGADDIAIGDEGRRYTPDRPFYPRTDSVPCPSDPSTYQTTPQKPQDEGFAQVGSHKGHYREWKITCISPAGGSKTGEFVQREVYLPDSRILIVDNWQTPGLMALLQAATWS